MTVTEIIILLTCLAVSFFGAKAAAFKTMSDLKKSGYNLQNFCWGLSKLLGCIVISGFLAGTLLRGPHALWVFLASILAAIIGQVFGMQKKPAANANDKEDNDKNSNDKDSNSK